MLIILFAACTTDRTHLTRVATISDRPAPEESLEPTGDGLATPVIEQTIDTSVSASSTPTTLTRLTATASVAATAGAERSSSPFQEGYEKTLFWVRSLDWSPDGSRLVAGSSDTCVTIWDAANGSQVGAVTGFPGTVRSIDWSPDGLWIATGNDGYPGFDLWSPETLEQAFAFPRAGDSLGYFAWSPDGRHSAFTGEGNQILIWDSGTRAVDNILGDKRLLPATTGIVWSPDGSMIASAASDGSIVIRKIKTGETLQRLKAHWGWVNDLDWSPDGSTVISVGDDGDVILWNPITGNMLRKLEDHSKPLYCVAWSPAGDRFATAGLDDQIIVWDSQLGKLLARYPTESEGILSLAWSPDGTRLAAGTGINSVQVWDTRSQELINTLPSACRFIGEQSAAQEVTSPGAPLVPTASTRLPDLSALDTTPQPEDPPAKPQAGDTWNSPIDGMVMTYVSAGPFWMGAAPGVWAQSNEMPGHSVELPGYWIDTTEVTNAMFARFVEQTGYRTEAEKLGSGVVINLQANTWDEVKDATWRHPQGPGSAIDGLEQHPVVQVSWNDAYTYCQWRGSRLPSEAEWEKAARGMDKRPYPWGNHAPNGELANLAIFNLPVIGDAFTVDDGFQTTAPVGSFPAGVSPFGLFDMAGNVWEWVQDWYDSYSSSESSNPNGPAVGEYRVIRGGSWGNPGWIARTSLRNAGLPTVRWDNLGFRCAHTP